MSNLGNLTLRIPRQLREDIKRYAKSRNTNVTQLTLEYYKHLLAAEIPQEAEQI